MDHDPTVSKQLRPIHHYSSCVCASGGVQLLESWVLCHALSCGGTRHNNSWPGITAAVAAGAVVFALLDPLLPKPAEHELLPAHDGHEQVEGEPTPADEVRARAAWCTVSYPAT